VEKRQGGHEADDGKETRLISGRDKEATRLMMEKRQG
jgi:hypothetical protein